MARPVKYDDTDILQLMAEIRVWRNSTTDAAIPLAFGFVLGPKPWPPAKLKKTRLRVKGKYARLQAKFEAVARQHPYILDPSRRTEIAVVLINSPRDPEKLARQRETLKVIAELREMADELEQQFWRSATDDADASSEPAAPSTRQRGKADGK